MTLQLRHVSKRFKGFSLRDINLDIPRGEYFVILGPSGAGKTLILEMIAGLLKPDSGEVLGTAGLKTGLIYQDYMLFPHLDTYHNIAYGPGLCKPKKSRQDIDALVRRLAGDLDIGHLLDRSTAHLSGGEKQRVAIARAMAVSPDIFLLDEPTAALDRNTRLNTRAMFLNWHKSAPQTTFIHVTHDFEEALGLADRIGLLMDGRLIHVANPGDLFNHPVNKKAADFLGYRNVFGGPVRDGKMQINGITLTVPVENADHVYIAIRSDDIILSPQSLQSSARNFFPGTVQNIFARASVMEIILDIGVPLHIDITRKSREEMDIKMGDRLWATFKVSALKVFPH